MTPMKCSLCMALVCSLATSQVGVPVVEPPEQARKLLDYAAQLEADAKRAVETGKQNSAAPADASMRRPVNNNGIYVDAPKVYDDSLLQQMLSSTQGRLSALQALDQGSITKGYGNVAGANQQISSAGVFGGQQFPATTGSSAAPAATTSISAPTSASPSDVLGEQVQLSYEIANLRLLLEGSLSDQILVSGQETFAKPRVTLGFPVALTPEKRYKDAVAIVEVYVETNERNDASDHGEKPSITALLPREKTYNIASISDKSASLGAGYAAGLAGVSGTFLWGHKTYFIVKDQDTLAMQFEPTAEDLAETNGGSLHSKRMRAFAWQFRPVLGRKFVQSGLKQVFVQLAFPGHSIRRMDVTSFGTVRLRTYWRKIDPKTGVLKEIVPDSFAVQGPFDIPIFDLHQKYGAVAKFNKGSLEDLGTGQMLVKLEDRLLPGTYLRVGANIIQPGVGPVPSDVKTTRFVANIADLATLKTFVISRDGTEFPLTIKPCTECNNFAVDRAGVRVNALDDSTSLLQVPISNFKVNGDAPPVLVIGGKVFGYSDAPIDRNCDFKAGTCVLSVALPTALLVASPMVAVKALMLDEDSQNQRMLRDNRTFTVFAQSAVQDKLVFLAKVKDEVSYLYNGYALNGVNIIWPKNVRLEPLAGAGNDESMRLITLPVEVVSSGSPLIVQRAETGNRPYLLAIPPAPGADGAAAGAVKKKETKFVEPVNLGSDEADITGERLDSITGVLFGAKPLTIAKRSSTVIKLTGLAAAGASAVAKTQDITLVTLGGASKIKLKVVTNKVEVVPN